MYEELKQFIDARIFPNGQQRITGQHHQDALHAVVDTLGADIAQKRDLTDKEVFIVSKGGTTFEQLAAAYAAKKAVYLATQVQVSEDDVPVLLPLVSRTEDEPGGAVNFYFGSVLVADGQPLAVYNEWRHTGSTDTLQDFAFVVSLATSTELAGKYTLPEGGIPEQDLSEEVQEKLNSGGGGGAEPLWVKFVWDDVDEMAYATADSPEIDEVVNAYKSGRIIFFVFEGTEYFTQVSGVDGVFIYLAHEITDLQGHSTSEWDGGHL